jgi:hypothetical protein
MNSGPFDSDLRQIGDYDCKNAVDAVVFKIRIKIILFFETLKTLFFAKSFAKIKITYTQFDVTIAFTEPKAEKLTSYKQKEPWLIQTVLDQN